MGYTVVVVFDIESEDAPFPIGRYISIQEDEVFYENSDGVVKSAPLDCVVMRGVIFEA